MKIKVEFFQKYHHFFAFLLFIILTVIAGWVVLTQLDSVIIGDDNDVFINPWADWWSLKAWMDNGVSLWSTEYMYYPTGASLIYHSFSHLNTLVSLALRPFFGTLAAYNLSILLNYVLIGFSMYQLAYYLTESSIAGIIAGIIFAFNSHSLYQSAHPVLVSIWCFPWITLYLMRAFRENKWKYAALAAFFAFLGTFTSTILLILIIVWSALLILYFIFAKNEPTPSIKLIMVYGLFSMIFIVPLLFPLLRAAMQGANSSFVMTSGDSISTDIFSLFVPYWYFWLERGAYIGIVPAYLILIAWGSQRKEARLWFFLFVFSFLMAIGPIPRFAGQAIDIVLPWSLLLAPVLRNMYRMMILMTMGMAMMVAYGWLAMAKQIENKKVLAGITAVIIIGIFAEYTAVPFPTTTPQVSPFYTTHLKNMADDVVIATMPTGRQEDKRYLYYQTLHEHKMTGGVISRASEDVFAFINDNPILRAGAVDLPPVPLPEDTNLALQELSEANVQYLIVDKILMEGDELLHVQDWVDAFPFPPLYEDDLIIVYETNRDF